MYLVVDVGSLAGRALFATQHSTRFDEQAFTEHFLRILCSALTDLSKYAHYAILCLDSKCWRYAKYPQYKQNRDTLKKTVDYPAYKESLHAVAAEMRQGLPLAVVKKASYEADDLVAYYAMKLAAPTVLVSQDKDIALLQGCTAHTRVYNFVTEMFVEPADRVLQRHILICRGDSSDNISSIIPRDVAGKLKYAKFGEKTITQYYNPKCFLNIDNSFWKNVPQADRDYMQLHYELNSSLIDLEQSPVHKESFGVPIRVPFDETAVQSFFYRRAPAYFDRNSRQLLELMVHYAT